MISSLSLLAYLDPGAGSIFIQIAVAGVLSATVAIKVFWGRLRRLFGAKDTTESEDDPPRPDQR